MKKFPSFKSAKTIPKETEQPNTDHVKTEKKQISKKPIPIKYKEDLSFGKRLDFNNFPTVQSVVKEESVIEGFDDSKNVVEAFKKRQVEFNRKLRNNPTNLNLWIDFVQFQEEICKRDFKKRHKLIERKISILRKGIELNPEALELVFMHLDLSEEIEDSSTLMRIWEKYLNFYDGENYYKLSKKYLDFRQNRFLAFSYDQVKAAFVEVFSNHKEAPVEVIIPLYRTFFKFLKRCGYNELIISVVQALIEVNIEQYNYGQVELDGYEDQWDFGLMDHIGDDVITFTEPDMLLDDQSDVSRFKKWIKVDRNCEKCFWHPKHLDSEEQVIFDDVKDFILILKDRNELLGFIKAILEILADVFEFDHYLRLREFITQIYKTLLPFYKNDWEFICQCFQLLHHQNPEGAEIFAKGHLNENRDLLESFLAYGRFQELIGNFQMAEKVYESVRKRSNEFDQIIESFPTRISKKHESNNSKLIVLGENVKADVYELVRSNPGDKSLYMRIIELIESTDPDLAMEVFNLIDEQQLKLFTFIED